MNRPILYITFLFSLILSSCIDSDLIDNDIAELNSQNDNVLIPLAIGNYWDYKITEIILDDEKNINNRNIINIRESIQNINIIDDKNWYELTSDYHTESILIRNYKDGVHYFDNEDEIFYKSNINIGDKYIVDSYQQTLTYVDGNDIKTITAQVDEYVELIELNRTMNFDNKLLKASVYKNYIISDNEEFNKNSKINFPIVEVYIVKNIGVFKELHYIEFDDNKSNAIVFIKQLTNYNKVLSNENTG